MVPLKKSLMEMTGLELLMFWGQTQKIVIYMVHAHQDYLLSQGEPAPCCHERDSIWE